MTEPAAEPNPTDIVNGAMESLFDPDSTPADRDTALDQIRDVADQAHQEPGDNG